MTKVFYHVIVNIKNIDEEYVNHFWNGLAFYNKGLKIGILNLDWDKLNKNVCFNSICSCKLEWFGREKKALTIHFCFSEKFSSASSYSIKDLWHCDSLLKGPRLLHKTYKDKRISIGQILSFFLFSFLLSFS